MSQITFVYRLVVPVLAFMHAGTEDVAAMPVWFAPKFGILMHFDTPLFPVGQQ